MKQAVVRQVEVLEAGDRLLSEAAVDERVDGGEDAVDLRDGERLLGFDAELVEETAPVARELLGELEAGGGVADEAQHVVAQEGVVVLE